MLLTLSKSRKGAAQALALARQQLAQAKASALPEACIRILENDVQQQETAMKQAQPLGQKMDQARARRRCKRCTSPKRISSKHSRR